MNRLAVFARVPTAGRVKTRLSPALPPDLSAELYRAMLSDALDLAVGAGTDQVVVFWALDPDRTPAPDVPHGVTVRRQEGEDLGERLAAAFSELLAAPEDRAVVIGADCPDLDATMIGEAFTALERRDLVLGPSRDGGYYLIGLRRPSPTLFKGVSWGTDRVLAQTLERAERAGLRVGTLGTLDDIDTPEDLVRFIARRGFGPPGTGHRTESALRELGLLPPRR